MEVLIRESIYYTESCPCELPLYYMGCIVGRVLVRGYRRYVICHTGFDDGRRGLVLDIDILSIMDSLLSKDIIFTFRLSIDYNIIVGLNIISDVVSELLPLSSYKIGDKYESIM